MSNIHVVLRRTAIGFAAIVQLLFFPVITFAETPSGQSTESPATVALEPSSSQGPASPTGADAHTYTFNPKTGLWENEHYTWDPKTKRTVPKKDDAYTYNPTTGTWDTKEWKYDAPSKTYKSNIVSQEKSPATASSTMAKAEAPATKQRPVNRQKQNGNQSAVLNNKVVTTAESGDAAVKNNTAAGSATTGSAHATTNVLSMLQSNWGLQGSNIATFDSSINGNVVGDLLLDPATIAANGLKIATANPSNLNVNIKESSTINNNIMVGAKSGDADVVSNTSAGDAKTGDATALANVINLINSAVDTGKSFVGNINIHGNLEGDILLPESIKSKLASGSEPPTTSLDASTITNGEMLEEFATNQNIRNNVHLSAQSGQATNSGNSQTGGATSGDGKTSLTLLNLTGKEVIGSNALLVFINVLGKWTGMIVDAPAGATASMLGNHTTQHRTVETTENSSLSAARNHTINNTITANAQSGDATISQNTKSGTASTGNTQAGVNLLNITNSQFSLADWFGVLFINVFGSWNGSFGVDTPIGDQPSSMPTPSPTPPVKEVKVYALSESEGGRTIVPVSLSKQRGTPTPAPTLEVWSAAATAPSQVLGSASTTPEWPTPPKENTHKDTATFVPAVAAILLGAALLLLERIIRKRKAPVV